MKAKKPPGEFRYHVFDPKDGATVCGFHVLAQATAWAGRVLGHDATVVDIATGEVFPAVVTRIVNPICPTRVWEATFGARYAATGDVILSQKYADSAKSAVVEMISSGAYEIEETPP